MKRIMTLLAMVLVAAVALAAVARDPGAVPEEPARTGPVPVLLVLDLQGPSAVTENSAERYTLIARYDDGAVADVTDRAQWTVDSPYADVTRGVLTVIDVPSEQTVTLSAWINEGLSLKAARTVTLVDRIGGAVTSKSGPSVPRPAERGAVGRGG